MVRVRNAWLSVDPYMRGRMNDVKSYVPPFQVGEPLEGGAVGKVVESRSPHFSEGDTVFHMMGWREEAVAPAEKFNKVPALGVPDQQWLGNLGLTGATAYFGLLRVARRGRRTSSSSRRLQARWDRRWSRSPRRRA
jgi:NADPH-dependent curcumin reductase CurA